MREIVRRAQNKQNHLADMGFTTVAVKAWVMMSHSNLNQELFLLIWKEAFKTAKMLDN